jgi:hypothetical protein
MTENNKPMTLHEKLETGVKAIALEKQGKLEEARKLERQIPLAPFLAKFAKEKIGVDFLIEQGFNLVEAEAEFGKNWLAR